MKLDFYIILGLVAFSLSCTEADYHSASDQVESTKEPSNQLDGEGLASADTEEAFVPPNNITGGYIFCAGETVTSEEITVVCRLEDEQKNPVDDPTLEWQVDIPENKQITAVVNAIEDPNGWQIRTGFSGADLSPVLVNSVSISTYSDSIHGSILIGDAIDANGTDSLSVIAANNGETIPTDFQFYRLIVYSVPSASSRYLAINRIRVQIDGVLCAEVFSAHAGFLCGLATELSASSETLRGESFPIWNAFTGTNALWHTDVDTFSTDAPFDGEQWAQLTFGSPVKIEQFRIRGCDSSTRCSSDRSPDRFSIVGSNDQTNWTQLYYYDGPSIGVDPHIANLRLP